MKSPFRQIMIRAAVLIPLLAAMLPLPSVRMTGVLLSGNAEQDFAETELDSSLICRRDESPGLVFRSSDRDEFVRPQQTDAPRPNRIPLVSLHGHRLANGLNAPLLT